MIFRWFALVILTCSMPAVAAKESDHAADMAAGLALFKQDVRQILLDNCLKCHGGEQIKSGFDMATRHSLLRGGDHGPAITPGDADSSALYKHIAHVEKPFMPYRKDKLPDQAIAQIGRWINLGAPYDQPLIDVDKRTIKKGMQVTDKDRAYWAFAPLSDSSPPEIDDDHWSRGPIDRFVLHRLRQNKLTPNKTADRRTLIRRVYFDVIGLPPTPQQVEAFVNDPAPTGEAYAKIVDELLADKAYGERWARHWLDVVRFAESMGGEQDYNRPYAFAYRDFVIDALNDDMPFDQFVRWQLAGDEAAPMNRQALAATAFLTLGVLPTQLTEKEFESARYDQLDDMLQTTGSAFLGLTIGCARCHDHKYDPIPARDYYRLLSTFTTTIRSHVRFDDADEPEPIEYQKGKPQEAAKMADASIIQVSSEGWPNTPHHADGRGFPHFYPQTYQLNRGDVNQKQGIAEPGYLQVLERRGASAATWHVDPPAGARTSYRRTSMANWITDVDRGAGHLLARVIVNRLWQHHFGRGLVATPNDFGHQGTPPTHPELLDYLARQLIQHDWRLKPLHKMMLTSTVYMQNPANDEADRKIDPINTWLWRYTPRRLEAEAIRDAMLFVAGDLDHTMHGPGTLDETTKRRSIYFMIKRSELVPMMQLFDAPEALVSIGRRPSTTIAPQALAFMNSPQVRNCAAHFAARLTGSTRDAIDQAYHLALGRAPTEKETADATRFIEHQTASYGDNNTRRALTDFCQVLLSTNEFIYIN
ncbi:DUF1549 domain-containing protein [Planctomycetales bacterium ZRK34]|nr:DUF1549 domain-containing protein [Planctomycetales bacterium ZRK34]